jgi:hypothetical protein
VYVGDRQAPPDLLNLLLEGTDLDPDKWLTHHMLILAFLRRIANSSNIQQKIFLKEQLHIYKIVQVLDITKFHPNVRIVPGLWYMGEFSPELEKPPTWKDTYILYRIESNAMYIPFLNSRSITGNIRSAVDLDEHEKQLHRTGPIWCQKHVELNLYVFFFRSFFSFSIQNQFLVQSKLLLPILHGIMSSKIRSTWCM